MGYLLSQMFFYMLGAFLLGLLLGWIFWFRRGGNGAELESARSELMQAGRERETLRLERDGLKANLDACMAARRGLEDHLALARSAPAIAPMRLAETTPAPVRLAETTPAPPAIDDLKKIRGIGRVNESKLNEMGITSFAQIAAWTATDTKRIGDVLQFEGRIEREEWIEQARVLASGASTEFSVRVEKGEVETSK